MAAQMAPIHKRTLDRNLVFWLLLLVLLFGFAARIARLGDKNIWWDEGWTIGTTRLNFTDLTYRIAADVHPPLYFWNLYGWVALTGESEFATRFLSLIWGVLTIAIVYPLTQTFTSRQVALLATLLTAASRFHVWWSQEVRMYAFATFAVTLSLYLLTRVLQKGNRRSWIVYTLGSIPVLYSFYVAGIALVAQNVFVLLTLRHRVSADRHFLCRWIASQLVIALAFTPWVMLALDKMQTWSTSTPFAFGLFIQLYVTVLSVGISTNISQWLIPTSAIALVAVVGFVALWRDALADQRRWGWRGAVFLALPVVLLLAMVYLSSLNRGLFYSPRIEVRYLVLSAPLFYILVACGVAAAWKQLRYAGWMLLLLIIALNGWLLADYHAARYVRDDYHTAMLVLSAYADPNDAVLLVSGNRYPLFLYYYEQTIPEERRPPVYLVPPRGTLAVTADNVDTHLSPIATDHERLWLASFERTIQDADNLTESWLDARYSRPLNVALGYNHLALYTHDGELPPVLNLAPQVEFDLPLNGGRLLGADLPTREFRPGDTAHLGLYVEGGEGQFDVRWVGDDGLVMAVQPVNLIGDPAIHRYDVPLPIAYGPPGRYRFLLADGTTLAQMVMQGTDSVPHERVIQDPLSVQLGDSVDRVDSLGYDLKPRRAAAGDKLTVTLYWQAASPVASSYTVFVQLVGPYNPSTGNPLWGQHDGAPVAGTFSTDRWPAGLIVRDRHTLVIDPTAPSGDYLLIAGMYDPTTGERLTIPNTSDDAIHLQTITLAE
jgi:4-amino-4-deoxy-L-arabinose transferase-like glycosyltransferase